MLILLVIVIIITAKRANPLETRHTESRTSFRRYRRHGVARRLPPHQLAECLPEPRLGHSYHDPVRYISTLLLVSETLPWRTGRQSGQYLDTFPPHHHHAFHACYA